MNTKLVQMFVAA